MKFRNKFVSKRIGTKTLASLLAFGMALGSPMAVFADDGETAVVAENTVQAKKTDGSEVFVSVSDYVRGMMERGAVRLNDETGYLEDTSTGQKVDPETGERLTETPDVPETPVIPDTPGNQVYPETPETPENLRLRSWRKRLWLKSAAVLRSCIKIYPKTTPLKEGRILH